MAKREFLSPSIIIRPPGPEAKKILRKDQRFVSQSYTRAYPFVVKRARGAWVEDADGNRFLDFTSGIAVCNTGHCHPRVVKAISRQAEQLIHMSGSDFYYGLQSSLAAKLSEISPGPREKRVFFGNSGAEAIEAALKLSHYHTKRPRILAFLGAFHGRTMGALSLTAAKWFTKRGFYPLVPGVTHVPYAYCYRCPYHHLQYPGCRAACVDWIEKISLSEASRPRKWQPFLSSPFKGRAAISSPLRNFIKSFTGWQKNLGSFLWMMRFKAEWEGLER